MAYSFLTQLSESKLFPTKSSLARHDHKTLAKWTLLNLCAMRILLLEDSTDGFARKYAKKTASQGNFDHWRNDATDLYLFLHAFNGVDAGDDWSGYGLQRKAVLQWMRSEGQKMSRDNEIVRLFMRLDSDLKINDDSLKAIRRLSMNWKKIDKAKKELTLTRIIQRFKAEMPRSELLSHLQDLLKGIRKMDEAIAENASAGSTSAASVATVVGGLGTGFDPNGHERSIYGKPKKPALLRR